MYDPAIVLRDSIITLDRSRHPHVSYQADWGKQFYDTMAILKPMFVSLWFLPKDQETIELQREEQEYEARMEAKELNQEQDD